MSDVKVNSKSLIDQLRNPDVFYTNFYDIMIKDRHKHGEKSLDSNWISDHFLDSLRIVSGNQPVFNFPATLSKLIYLLYFTRRRLEDTSEIYIFDPCGGWFGRQTGLMAAFCMPTFEEIKVHYHCTDVNTMTAGRPEMLHKFWDFYINSRIGTDFDLYRSFAPAERIFDDKFFQDMIGKYDFAFTSPPYFTNEKYSEDENQSYLLYKTYPEWRDGFLKGMIKNTYDLLKPGAQFWLNIADVNTNKGNQQYYPLQNDSVRLAKECGFEHIDTYYMTQHPFPGNESTKNIIKILEKEKKFEPIFLFQKR
ncbi:MAG: DNA methyltransferase [Candidatus Kapabacteria bacterium]|nr:DNA methyltransferase [Candidatus Kapabacteria bacterium]